MIMMIWDKFFRLFFVVDVVSVSITPTMAKSKTIIDTHTFYKMIKRSWMATGALPGRPESETRFQSLPFAMFL